MTLNIPNLDRLISTLGRVSPERFRMSGWGRPSITHDCGTAGCVAGWIDAHLVADGIIAKDGRVDENQTSAWLGLTFQEAYPIFYPKGWEARTFTPAEAIRTLKHLRAKFLRTGTVVVDWDAPEAVETQRKPWAPPVVIGADKPLPAELTRLVREPATVTEA